MASCTEMRLVLVNCNEIIVPVECIKFLNIKEIEAPDRYYEDGRFYMPNQTKYAKNIAFGLINRENIRYSRDFVKGFDTDVDALLINCGNIDSLQLNYDDGTSESFYVKYLSDNKKNKYQRAWLCDDVLKVSIRKPYKE